MKISDLALFAGMVSVFVVSGFALYTLMVSYPIGSAF